MTTCPTNRLRPSASGRRKSGAVGWAAAVGLTVAAALAAPARAETVVVTRAACDHLVRYEAPPDVAYTPGVDVYGRSVAPADVGGGSAVRIPDEIQIALGFDIAERYGFGTGGRYEGKASVGTVTVKNGRAFYNGVPLEQGDRHAIAEACRKLYGPSR